MPDAPEAAVAAAREALGCVRRLSPRGPECWFHGGNPWSDRGCPVAVAAADAAVDAARPSIQAEALREAAVLAVAFLRRPYRQTPHADTAELIDTVEVLLTQRADRIEGAS